MSRLTKRISMENEDIIIYGEGKYTNITVGDMKPSDTREVMKKLAEYEDLEEQGLLLKLPCKVGDKYFRILYGEIYENEFNNRATMVSMLDDGAFGKTVFLTKEEAEQELRRLEGK